MTSSKSGVSPSYISACVAAPAGIGSAAPLTRGDDVERRRRVVGLRRRLGGQRQPDDRTHHRQPYAASGPPPRRRPPGPSRTRSLSRRTYPRVRSCAATSASMLAARCPGPRHLRAPSCSASAPRRSSARRSSSPAGGAAGRAWRRPSASRRSARSPGGRCGCRGEGTTAIIAIGAGRRRLAALYVLPRVEELRGALRSGAAARARRGRRSPRCRSSSSSASGSSAPGSTPTCPSTCSRSTGSRPAAASG